MDERRVPAEPAILMGPGWRISQELDRRGWSQKDLAEVLGRPLQAVNEILNASKQITPDTAVQLGQAFGTTAEFWANLEALYRVASFFILAVIALAVAYLYNRTAKHV